MCHEIEELIPQMAKLTLSGSSNDTRTYTGPPNLVKPTPGTHPVQYDYEGDITMSNSKDQNDCVSEKHHSSGKINLTHLRTLESYSSG